MTNHELLKSVINKLANIRGRRKNISLFLVLLKLITTSWQIALKRNPLKSEIDTIIGHDPINADLDDHLDENKCPSVGIQFHLIF